MAAALKKSTASTLTIKSDDAKEIAATPEERIARHVATVAIVQAAVGMEQWSKESVGEADFTALATKISEQTDAMHSGDMKGIESMLFAQALTLQATFTALSRRAALNAGTHIGATDTYLRLALRAQGQCRATLETLANIKNPRPVAFVKQANIANGPQQINNGGNEANNPVVRARGKRKDAKRTIDRYEGNAWQTTGHQSEEQSRPKQSTHGNRGNGPQGREQLKARRRRHATPTRALCGWNCGRWGAR